jgi:4-carboxymuconolactone decarboxylase
MGVRLRTGWLCKAPYKWGERVKIGKRVGLTADEIERLKRSLDARRLIELPILVGQYQGLAYLQNALRLRLIAGNPGLSAR